MFYTYILFSPGRQRYYVGSTQSVETRLREHNSGKSLSTHSGVPWELVLTEAFPTRSEAMRQEHKIKARGIGRYLADLARSQAG